MTRFEGSVLCSCLVLCLTGCPDEFFYDNDCKPADSSELAGMLLQCELIDYPLEQCLAVCGKSVDTWDVSQVTKMDYMFQYMAEFNVDISGWDTSSVTSMKKMFEGAYAFDQDISGWCVSRIPQEPMGFSDDASLSPEHKPVWGTCPQPE